MSRKFVARGVVGAYKKGPERVTLILRDHEDGPFEGEHQVLFQPRDPELFRHIEREMGKTLAERDSIEQFKVELKIHW